MCNEKTIDCNLAPSKKMGRVMEDKGEEPKPTLLRSILTINENGEIRLFGFTIRKGKK